MPCFLLLVSLQVSGQILINAPEPAGNPNFGEDSKPWQTACAGKNGFNQYFAKISWAGAPNADNEFILELSNATGDFSEATELAKSSENALVQNPGFEFALPKDTRGEGYKMRVRSTSPASTSPASEAHSMYYMDVTTNINISNDGSGTPPGTVCSTGPITLQVDNIENPETYQYIWYKSGTQLTGENSHTLNVSTSGIYQAFIYYGPNCTGSGNTDSNFVDVTIGSSGIGVALNNPSKTALCSGDTETLTIASTNTAWTYQWFKDNTAITGATSSSYTINANNTGFEGDYQVEISAAGVCNERSNTVTITNADNFTITRVNPENIVVLPSQPQTLTVSTTAVSPKFQWFRDGAPVGTDSSTLAITQEGSYHVEVTQNGGTCPGTKKISETTTTVTPESFEITIDYTATYTPCAEDNIVLEMTQISAIADDGSKTDVTTTLKNALDYQWLKDGSNIGGATSSIISLTNVSENGSYLLNATIDTIPVGSNPLTVVLKSSENLTISTTSTVFCNAGNDINLSTTTNLSGANFEWLKNGVSINNTTDMELTINEPGSYRLVIDKNGCPLTSNEITIEPFDDNLISLDFENEVVIPEGTTKTLNASGGTSYTWYNSDNVEIGNTSSYVINTEGAYTLTAEIDGCQIVKQFTVAYRDTFNVPNVITPNGDGANDQWVVPNSYSNKQDINIVIYNHKGLEVMNVMGYQNNWPESSTAFTKQNSVFYYVIQKASKTLKQGTITVIR